MSQERPFEDWAKEARSRTASNLRTLAQEVEAGDVLSVAVSFIQKNGHSMGQMIWTETQLALFMLLAAIEVTKADTMNCYQHTAHREPGQGLRVVPTKGDLNDE